MSKQTEAMRLALEALEFFKGLSLSMKEIERAEEAITALQAALAEQPAQQEPFCYHDGRNIVGKEFADHSDVFPLYTSPQPSKPHAPLPTMAEAIEFARKVLKDPNADAFTRQRAAFDLLLAFENHEEQS